MSDKVDIALAMLSEKDKREMWSKLNATYGKQITTPPSSKKSKITPEDYIQSEKCLRNLEVVDYTQIHAYFRVSHKTIKTYTWIFKVLDITINKCGRNILLKPEKVLGLKEYIFKNGMSFNSLNKLLRKDKAALLRLRQYLDDYRTDLIRPKVLVS